MPSFLARFANTAILVLCGFVTFSASANAAVITRNYDIVASGFVRTFGGSGTAPTDPVLLNFDLTFDSAVITTNSSLGIQVNSFNLPYTLSSFSYAPGGTLSLSSLFTQNVGFGISPPGFGAFINSPLNNSSGGYFRYIPVANSISNDWSDFSISVRSTERHVPEPSTIALLCMAMLSLFGFGLMRRRAVT